MEEYPEELRTPPVTLVSLVGCPELHLGVSSFLHSEQPPINTLALPDFSKVSVFAGKGKQREGILDSVVPAAGILKRDWLLKHRTRVPAVVAAMFGTDRVSGDPAQWQQVCADIDNVKAVVRGRNIKFVVVLVQTSTRDDVSEDIIIALRKRAEVDAKCLVTFVQKDVTEQKQSLNRLASIFAELSNIYYREQARRIKARVEKKNTSSFELNIRYCFKVAVYAEFRRDWSEALRFYEDGYRALLEMIKVSTRLPPVQCVVEIKTVAEQFSFKVSTLLLHGGKVAEAITWFRKHVVSYECFVGAPEIAFLHWEWLNRQYLVFAELLETSSASVPSSVSPCFGISDNPLTEWEFQPAYYYQKSAHYLKEKRKSFDQSFEEADMIDGASESVAPSVFVGQFARLLDDGDTTMLPLTDLEYKSYAFVEGRRFQDSIEIIALFRRASESFNSLKASRMTAYCSMGIAKEYFASKDFGNAKQLFNGIANMYRQEGWVTLLWETLGYLRVCSQKLALPKDFIECSLEMASLPTAFAESMRTPDDELRYGPGGAPCLSRRQMIQDDVFRLLKGESSLISDTDDFKLSLTEDQIINLEIDPISPLRIALLASVAFHDQTVKPGASTFVTLALLSQLPNPLELDQLEIQFNQPVCNFVVSSVQKHHSAENISTNEHGHREEMAQNLTLETNKWLRLTFKVESGQSGKLECLSVTAKLATHLRICCRAESTASMEGPPIWKFEDRVETFPIPLKDHDLSISGQKVIQVEDPEPQVDLTLNASSPALVGEIYTVPVLISSRGHAVHFGELKINIVDARGGGLMSPREAESFSFDNHHVELLSISGMIEEDESLKDDDSIKKITQSFGVVSVPYMGIGESWSGKLEIKWHRPKSVMLYVSLSYSPQNEGSPLQKVNVHKSLLIEGKTPIVVTQHFMLPFRRDPLLLSKIKPHSDSDQITSLALNETNILIVRIKNSCEIPLELTGMAVKSDLNGPASRCTINQVAGSLSQPTLLVPGGEFKQIFSVTPRINSLKLELGSLQIKWRRSLSLDKETDAVEVTHKLPEICIERPPLIVSLECPPHAVLGVPFMVYLRLKNLTKFLQEIKHMLGDSQSFVFSGSHNQTAFVLPKSEHVIPCKFVPLCSGHHQIPRFTITAVRFSAVLQPSVVASTIFVYPSEPHLNLEVEKKRVEQVPAEVSS